MLHIFDHADSWRAYSCCAWIFLAGLSYRIQTSLTFRTILSLEGYCECDLKGWTKFFFITFFGLGSCNLPRFAFRHLLALIIWCQTISKFHLMSSFIIIWITCHFFSKYHTAQEETKPPLLSVAHLNREHPFALVWQMTCNPCLCGK